MPLGEHDLTACWSVKAAPGKDARVASSAGFAGPPACNARMRPSAARGGSWPAFLYTEQAKITGGSPTLFCDWSPVCAEMRGVWIEEMRNWL